MSADVLSAETLNILLYFQSKTKLQISTWMLPLLNTFDDSLDTLNRFPRFWTRELLLHVRMKLAIIRVRGRYDHIIELLPLQNIFCSRLYSTTFNLLIFAFVTPRASEKLETLEIHYLTVRKMKWKLPFQSGPNKRSNGSNNIPIPSSNRGLKRLWDECQVQVTEQGIKHIYGSLSY